MVNRLEGMFKKHSFFFLIKIPGNLLLPGILLMLFLEITSLSMVTFLEAQK
jgi:hypothetical protein